jgi:tetratricopeptide (TPR) repeat protein
MLSQDSPPPLTPARAISGAAEPSSVPAGHPTSPHPSPRIPDHELLKIIGRGSYGEVWLARNIMGAFRAVKIVYRATFESDRPYDREFEGLQKFEPVSRSHESQIAILHVGRNERDGYFYHVMELADDERTGNQVDADHYKPRTLSTELKARSRLPPGECVKLGLALTTALDHLHRNGLIHRDIKPSNIIFVNGLPKLADIGLVATLDATCSFVGTEGYLPPEGPRTPQADLYSLGKVLYEASTGKDRRDFPELPTLLESMPEEKGIIELNAIVVKACKPDPCLRYASADQMHDDLLLLMAGKSVLRTHALERRLKTMTRIGVLTAAVLILGAVPYSLAIREAHRAIVNASRADHAAHEAEAARLLAEVHQRKAQTEAAKSQEVALLLKDMLRSVGPSVALGRDTSMLREILDQTARRVGRELTNQPEVAAELQNTIGEVFLALGQYDEAEAIHRRTLALRTGLFGPEYLATAESVHNLARTLLAQGRLAEAEPLERQALATRIRLRGGEDAEVADSFSNLGSILLNEGNRAEAETTFRKVLALRRKLFGQEAAGVADSLSNLAGVLFAQGDYAEAEANYREALAMSRKLLGNDHPDVVLILNRLGKMLAEQGRPTEAESAHREALAIARKVLGDGHPLADQSLSNLADILQKQDKLAEVEALYRGDLALAVKRLGTEDPALAVKLGRLGANLRGQTNLVEAEALEQEALSLARKHATTDPDASEEIIARLAEIHSRYKQFAQAEPLCRDALDSARTFSPSPSVRFEYRAAALAGCLRDQNRWAEAETLYRDALASGRLVATNDLPRLEKRVNDLADVLEYQGKLPEAETLYRETLALKKQRVGNDARDVGLLFRSLAYVLEREAKLPEAEAAFRQSLAIAEKVGGKNHPLDATWALYGLAWVLQMEGKLPDAETIAGQALTLRRNLTPRKEDELVLGDSLYQLAVLLWSDHKLAEAEVPARECVAFYESKTPNGWPTFNARSTLAAILLEQQKYPEAESLLLSAYHGLNQPEGTFPAAVKPRLKETIERLARLCEETKRPSDALAWKRKLAELDQPPLQSSGSNAPPERQPL